MSSILQNAIESIQVGIEDFQSDDSRRSASAVRNISAGLLLLFKEKLCRLSPADDPHLLILKDVRPVLNEDGSLGLKGYAGKGEKTETVNVNDIQKLFSSMGVKADWELFGKINRLRNDLEHFYSSQEPAAIREIISNSLVLIRDFITNELGEQPVSMIGKASWGALLDVNEIYEKELAECKKSLNRIDWKFHTVQQAINEIRCPNCPSELVKADKDCGEYPDIKLSCTSCGHGFLFSDVLADSVHHALFADAYIAMTDGGEHPWDDCEECGEPTFVLEENACMSCGYQPQYYKCAYCHCDLEKHEEDSKMCDRCAYVQDMMSKE